VWILRDNNPFPIPVVMGATDGKFTEIKSEGIAPGQALIVETLKEAR
jgi:hypothetical protein